MLFKKLHFDLKKISSLIYIFIYSFLSSILLIFIPIIFATMLKPLNTKFLDQLLPIARNQYYIPFRSNDSRNYLLGIFIVLVTALIYIIIYIKTIKKINNQKVHLKYFFYFILFVLSCYISAITYKLFKIGWNNTVSLLNLSIELFSTIKLYLLPILLTFACFIISYAVLKTKILFQFGKFMNRQKKINFSLPSFFINISVLFLIFVLLFNPRYQFSYEKIANYGGEAIHQFHHGNFFIAPINEVINGKMLLVNAQAQYGILLTYIPAFILSIIGFSYSNFNLFNIIISIIYVYIFYLFLVIATNNRFLSFIGVIGFIKLSFYRIFWPYEIYTLPSTTPIRYFFDIISIYFVYELFRNFSFKKLHFSSLILALTFFYNTEIGLSIILAYLGVILVNLLINFKNKETQLRTFYSIISLIFFLLIIAFSISLFTYFRIGQLPDWYSYFSYIFIYGKGAFDIPMPFIGPYYFVIIIYIITFYSLIYKFLSRNLVNFHILLFILLYGILNFFYYLMFSEPHHFLTILHPSILLSVILLKDLIKNKSYLTKLPAPQSALIITFSFFILGYLFWDPIKTWSYVMLRFNNRYGNLTQPYYHWKNKAVNFYLSDSDGSDFSKSVKAIMSLSKNKKNIVILSRYDTILYVMTQKTSLLNHPIVEYDLTFIKEREDAINIILKDKPQYIYVFSDNYRTMVSWTIHEIWDAVRDKYAFVKNAGVVDVYKLTNN